MTSRKRLGIPVTSSVNYNHSTQGRKPDGVSKVVPGGVLSLFRSLALLLREVMAGSVMLPTMDFMADPVSRLD